MRRIWMCAAVLALALALAGCAGAGEPCRRDVLAMDTLMTLTVYGPEGGAAAERGEAVLREMEARLSVTREDSEIARANRGEDVDLSEDTAALLEAALALCRETEGALDVTVYPAVRAWGFTTGEYRTPGGAELEAALEKVGYEQVRPEGNRLALPEGVELDLGAVAKGWAGDRLAEMMRSMGVSSAIMELGGSVHTLGRRPDGSLWRVAVRAPEGGYAGVLEMGEGALVTSGGYERYFRQDGEVYCHIIDPATARPVENGLASVSVAAERGVRADGLSTALFVMGRERAVDFWREKGGFEMILLGADGSAAVTEGLADRFALYGEWEGRELEILRR